VLQKRGRWVIYHPRNVEGLTGEGERTITGCKVWLFVESMFFNIHQSYNFNTLVYSLKILYRTPLKMRRRRSEVEWRCENCPLG